MTDKTKSEFKLYLKDTGRALLAYATFIAISGVLSFLFMMGGFSLADELRIETYPFYIAAAALLPLSFYSIFRAFELHDGAAQAVFPFDKVVRYRFFGGMAIIFKTKPLRRKLLISLAVLNGAIILLPYRLGYRFLAAALLPAFEGVSPKLLVTAIACPVFSLLLILAKTSAHKWWIIAPTGERDKILGAKSHNLRLLLEIGKIAIVYGLAYPILPSVFMLMLSMVLTFGQFTLWIWVGVFAFILLLFIIRASVAVSKRRRFLKKMKRTVSRNGYTISKIQRPIMSVFLPDRDEDFTISRDGKTYSVKLIGSARRSRPMYISPDGVITEKHTVSFMKITLFHVMHDTRYELSGENKIVVICPMPRRVYVNYGRTDTAPDDGDGGIAPVYVSMVAAAKGKGARATDRSIHGPGYVSDVDRGIIKPFETGDFIGDVKFFSSDGFISAIDNDYIGRPRGK